MRRFDWFHAAVVAFIVACLGLIVWAIVAALNPPEPKSGRVVGRPHYAPWVQISISCIKGVCAVTPIHHPERWELCVIPDDSQGDFTEQHCFEVTSGKWNAVAMGDHYYTEDGI